MPSNSRASDGFRYRTANGEADFTVFARILERSFAIPTDGCRVLWNRLGADMRLLDDGREIAACLGWYAAGQWFGGRSIRCAGIAAVGVEPHRRGAGLATRIVADALRETAEQGFAIATLYPSNLALYWRADFELSGARYELRTRCAGLARNKSPESVIPLEKGVLDPRVRALHARAATLTNGWMDRSDALWDRVREFKGDVREGFGVVRGDELAGYVFLARHKRRGLGFDIVVGDCAAVDGAAGRALLAFLASHGTTAVDVSLFVPPSDPIIGLLQDLPDRHILHHPWMVRVLDVERAFAARGYAQVASGEVEFEVDDRILPRNAGRFVLSVTHGAGRVTRGGEGRVRIAARALGPWFAGHMSAESLAYAGLIEGPASDLATMSALFAGSPPHMSDFF